MKSSFSVTNRAGLKKYILARLKAERPHLGITRVSEEALNRYEFRLREIIDYEISTHPSKGKTFRP